MVLQKCFVCLIKIWIQLMKMGSQQNKGMTDRKEMSKLHTILAEYVSFLYPCEMVLSCVCFIKIGIQLELMKFGGQQNNGMTYLKEMSKLHTILAKYASYFDTIGPLSLTFY
jgi:hypothetical protein